MTRATRLKERWTTRSFVTLKGKAELPGPARRSSFPFVFRSTANRLPEVRQACPFPFLTTENDARIR